MILSAIKGENIWQFVDLTDLAVPPDKTKLVPLCEIAKLPLQKVAAVCVWPQFVVRAGELLAGTGIKVATVINFPAGTAALVSVLAEIARAIAAGADELDIVFPRDLFFAGKNKEVIYFLHACRTACAGHVLKIILESGAFPDDASLASAARLVCASGADFLKTSTGKIAAGATLSAARILLQVLQEYSGNTGLKVSGGIRSIESASAYLALAEEMMGAAWVTPVHFRVGASALK